MAVLISRGSEGCEFFVFAFGIRCISDEYRCNDGPIDDSYARTFNVESWIYLEILNAITNCSLVARQLVALKLRHQTLNVMFKLTCITATYTHQADKI